MAVSSEVTLFIALSLRCASSEFEKSEIDLDSGSALHHFVREFPTRWQVLTHDLVAVLGNPLHVV